MTPSHVVIRLVDVQRVEDIEPLSLLWVESRAPQRAHATREVQRRLVSALTRDDFMAFVARVGEQDVGFAVLSLGSVLPLLDESVASIDHLFVRPDFRRRGIGRALLARAGRVAEEQGASQITASVPATGRPGQRFFARLGFTPLVVRRVASVATLQRRLVPGPCPAHDVTVRRRRSLRARSRALALRARSSG
ncbi:MAG: GNAT family N-acetyltransferase [Actinomycetota bacterium]